MQCLHLHELQDFFTTSVFYHGILVSGWKRYAAAPPRMTMALPVQCYVFSNRMIEG